MLRSLRLIASLLLVAGLVLIGTLAIALHGPAIEARLLPVWRSVIVEWEPGADPKTGMAGSLYGNKERGHCRLLEIIAMVRDGDVWRRSWFAVDGRELRQYRTRPDGWQSLGTWRFDRCGDRLRITAHFSCHRLWDTPASLGEWPAPCRRADAPHS